MKAMTTCLAVISRLCRKPTKVGTGRLVMVDSFSFRSAESLSGKSTTFVGVGWLADTFKSGPKNVKDSARCSVASLETSCHGLVGRAFFLTGIVVGLARLALRCGREIAKMS
jgi:hypothetical protein